MITVRPGRHDERSREEQGAMSETSEVPVNDIWEDIHREAIEPNAEAIAEIIGPGAALAAGGAR
jgi:hypothetical protein